MNLLILAAGMGSRYGGLKQVDGIGPNGETIVDYSVFDAIRAGFDRVVFVIRRDFEDVFRRAVVDELTPHIEVDIAFQELDSLPPGIVPPTDRTKPWGTAHALWCARSKVNDPFVVLNADDFYGEESFRIAADFLSGRVTDRLSALIGFPLEKTLSEFGPVSRGVCEVDGEDYLSEVVERMQVRMTADGPIYLNDSGVVHRIKPKRAVSMNMWALHASVFELIEAELMQFLDVHGGDLKTEFLIPTVFNRFVRESILRIAVLPTPSEWFGLTYSDDRNQATSRIEQLIKHGNYPHRLWP